MADVSVIKLPSGQTYNVFKAGTMIVKGTIGTGGTITTLPSTHKAGWAYRVITAGTYAGYSCAIDDLIICTTDGTSNNNAHWTITKATAGGGDVSTKADKVTGATDGNIASLDSSGNLVDSGKTLGKSVPSDAKFTDTTYSAATQSAAGLMSATDKTKLDGIASGATANVGTITGITMNGASKGTSGVVDLGTVITSHQDISGKMNASLKGAANGVAELDSNGKVPSSQLPAYVDDVLEYSSTSAFPTTGETGKIYVATDTNKTYRWSGTAYVEISASLALGETSSTAYRGDRGKTAYDHASAKGSAFSSGLYKITTNAQGHVTDATAVEKSDITGLGIPGSDTTYSNATQSAAGLMSSTDKTKLDGIASGATANVGTITGITMNGTSKGTSGVVDLGTVITSHQDISGKADKVSSATAGDVATLDANGNLIDSGKTLGVSVPANAVFTDTTYESKQAASGGTAVSLVTTGEKYTWNNKREVPAVTSSDNNKVLRVVNGAWAAVLLPSASGVSF